MTAGRRAVLAAALLGAAGCSGTTLGVSSGAVAGAAATGCLLAPLPHAGGTTTIGLPVGSAVCLDTSGVSGVLHVLDRTPAVLAGRAAGPYRAVRPGRGRLAVSETPRCIPGQACPQVVLLLGQVQVTVTPLGG